jgi:hypothetical protein
MRPLLSASERRVAPVCDCSSPSQAARIGGPERSRRLAGSGHRQPRWRRHHKYRASTKAGVCPLCVSDVLLAKGAHLHGLDRPATAAALLCRESRSERLLGSCKRTQASGGMRSSAGKGPRHRNATVAEVASTVFSRPPGDPRFVRSAYSAAACRRPAARPVAVPLWTTCKSGSGTRAGYRRPAKMRNPHPAGATLFPLAYAASGVAPRAESVTLVRRGRWRRSHYLEAWPL